MLELGVRIMMPTRTTAAFGLWSSVAQQYWEILEPTVQQIIANRHQAIGRDNRADKNRVGDGAAGNFAQEAFGG
jgi:hypothetical protein